MNETTIKNHVKKLGIFPCMKGYTYLCRAIQLVYSDSEYFCCSAEELYMSIAHENDTTPSCVERNIRTAIRASKSNICRGISAKKLIFIIAESLSSSTLFE